jgi:DnaJ-class molecular chaperone
MSNPLGYYYPAGAEHDPRAPWNREDADDCETCNGRGSIGDGDDTEDCPACSGTGLGKTPSETRAQYLEDKADMERDEDKG